MSLEIKRERVGEIEILAPEGRLDTESAGDLELAIHECLSAGTTHFLLDFSAVGYISSAGLSAVLMLAKAIHGTGELKLCSLSPHVRQVFDLACLTTVLDIRASRNEALAEAMAARTCSVQHAALSILAPQPLPRPTKIDPRIVEAARLLGALQPRGPTRAPTPPLAGGGQATLVSRAVGIAHTTTDNKPGWFSKLLSTLFGKHG